MLCVRREKKDVEMDKSPKCILMSSIDPLFLPPNCSFLVSGLRGTERQLEQMKSRMRTGIIVLNSVQSCQTATIYLDEVLMTLGQTGVRNKQA